MKRIANILPIFLVAVMFASPVFAGEKDKTNAKKDIISVAVEAGAFTTLAKALTAAGLVDALKGEGPFTVFAPTDAAFAKLPKGTIESLLKDKEALKDILLYHVVKGSVDAKAATKLASATTLSGKDVHISVKEGNVMINSAMVTSADVAASNGVIHVIDEVLIPHKH